MLLKARINGIQGELENSVILLRNAGRYVPSGFNSNGRWGDNDTAIRFYMEHARIPYTTARMFDITGDRDAALRHYREALVTWDSTAADFPLIDQTRRRIRELTGSS